MRFARIAVSTIAITILLYSWSAQAFECPRHIAKAEEAIAKATELLASLKADMDRMMDPDEMALVHNLLLNGRIMLSAAKRSHNIPQGPYDHARAIAKSDAARGYAMATEILHLRYLKALSKKN